MKPLILYFIFSFFINCKISEEKLSSEVFNSALEKNVGIAEELNHSIRGSGVLISKNQIITCYHILNSFSSPPLIKINHFKEKLIKVKSIKKEYLVDLALLELEEDIANYKSIQPESNPKIGEKIFTVANPFGLESSLLYGYISSLDTLGKDSQYPLLSFIQVQNISYPGVSGAGVYTMNGKIIGINRAAYGFSASTGIGFVIPWDYILLFLDNHKK